MTKKEKKILMQKMSGMPAPKTRKRRARKARTQNKVQAPMRNGAGRPRGRKRQRGGKGAPTVDGNTRAFVIPIDEQIGIVNGTVGYATSIVTVNPGVPSFLPFASRVAQNYERYEFEDLVLTYRPSASVFATVGAQGFVGISATMDAAQAAPSNQAQAEVLYHSPIVETASPTSLRLPKSFLQCKSLREKFFVMQNGIVPAGSDPHQYICAQVFMWTNGQANTNQIGELRVTGRLKLSNPASELSNASTPNYQVALFGSTNQPTGTTTTAFSCPFVNVITNPVGFTQDVSLAIFTLPAGNWLVDFVSDCDLSGVNTTGNLVWTTWLNVNGAIPAGMPFISTTCPGPSATNAVIFHAASSCSWFVQSNGATTVTGRGQATYAAGVPDWDGSIRFTAV